ncbi:MAG TPA: hypothetical protein VIZ32_00775, partial [Vicinamibacterales bacterium]
KSFYCPFSRDRVTRPWDERHSRGDEMPLTVDEVGRPAVERRFHQYFRPSSARFDKTKPTFHTSNTSTVPNTAVGPLVLWSERGVGLAIDYEAAC